MAGLVAPLGSSCGARDTALARPPQPRAPGGCATPLSTLSTNQGLANQGLAQAVRRAEPFKRYSASASVRMVNLSRAPAHAVDLNQAYGQKVPLAPVQKARAAIESGAIADQAAFGVRGARP